MIALAQVRGKRMRLRASTIYASQTSDSYTSLLCSKPCCSQDFLDDEAKLMTVYQGGDSGINKRW